MSGSSFGFCSTSVNCADVKSKSDHTTCSQWVKAQGSLDQFVKILTTPLVVKGVSISAMCASKSKAKAFYNALKKCYCGGSSMGAIIGIVIGSLALIAIVVFVALRMSKKKKRKKGK
jgi:hypothetical protein